MHQHQNITITLSEWNIFNPLRTLKMISKRTVFPRDYAWCLRVNFTRCPQKKVAIFPPKSQFLSETFEIFIVGTLFHSRFSAFSELTIFDFKRPKSKFEIFKNSRKNRGFFLNFFQAKFLVGTDAEKIQIICS